MKQLSMLMSLVLITCDSAPERGSALGAILAQSIGEFHRPESVAFSFDGKYLFVGNCASDLFGADKKKVGFVTGVGSISRCTVDEEGNVKLEKQKFITGLNGPLGLGILTKATGKYPVGTLLVNQGMSLQVDKNGKSVTNINQLGVGVDLYDPNSGQLLGRISMGPGSAVAKAIGHVPLILNSIAFDKAGNLYITDTAKGGGRLQPKVAQNPGLIRIEHGSIDDPSKGGISFTPMPGVPNGIGYWDKEDAIVIVTMGGSDKPGGTAIYKVPVASFPLEEIPAPLFGDVGTADGIAFTPAGTMITSRFSGDLLAIPYNGVPRPVVMEPFVAPADHRILTLKDGTSILAVPEQDRADPNPWKQKVKIVRLPDNF